jgi:cobalt-zinc-cadmium efflux system outer membrane protein
VRQRREFLEGAIPQQVENAYQRFETAKQALQLLTGVIDQSQANLKIIRAAYNLGQLRALDVLNEQRRLIDATFLYIDAQLEKEQAQIELEHATGGTIR